MNPITLLYSNRHHILTADLHTAYRQESNFLYYTSIWEPWYRAIIQWNDTYIFIPERNEKKILREGESLSAESIQQHNPNVQIHPLSAWQTILLTLYTEHKIIESNIHLVNYPAAEEKEELTNLLWILIQDIPTLDQSPRAIKSAEELVKIRKAQQITLEAIKYATQDLKAGLYEYEIAAKLSYYYASHWYSDAFPPIVANGNNACILHYTKNNSIIQEGDLLLIDTGAYVDGYCWDCSRTIMLPPLEREDRRDHINNELLSIVQSVHDDCIAYAKPWITLKELHDYALQWFEQRFSEQSLERKKEYFPHSIGHSIGLDVHDPFDKNHPLEVGMVITIEPWLYIKELGVGIRLENIIVITEKGAEIVS